MQRVISKLALVVLAFAMAQGCSRNVRDPGGVTVDDRPIGGVTSTQGSDGYPGSTGVTTSGGDLTQGGFEAMSLDDPNSLLAQRVFHFDFDSSEVQPQDQAALAAHGQYLALNPHINVTLIGHADERGSREYNLALGERRANAVAQLLSFQGGALSQMSVVSYGEERPVSNGHDEASWAENRRVELVYPGER